jgi:hypothetical protein
VSRPLADALAKLHAAGATLSGSVFTAAQREALEEFSRRTGAIRRLPRGRGVVYEMLRPEAVALELRRLRPGAVDAVDPALPLRAQNLARDRNTKRGRHTHEHAYALLKAIGSDCRWHSQTRGTLELGALCRLTGAAALEIAAEDDWHTDQPLWLVENQALFSRTDWLPEAAPGSLLYYTGTLSDLHLAWLAGRPRAPQIYYFADYDGAGLLNYVKLQQASRAPVEFWLMPGWRELLRRYGSAELWRRTRQQAEGAVARVPSEQWPQTVRELLAALRTEGVALEHEGVWLARREAAASHCR